MTFWLESYLEEVEARMDAELRNHDPVNHPSHYTAGKYEVIDIIEDQVGKEGFRGYCLGNVLKYVCRAGKKTESPLEDLKKAAWYLNHYITKYEEGKDE